MIIQAISLLDELDKEINIYAMRVKEWYGWHFPELQKIVLDNIQYSKVILKMGYRKNAHDLDFSDILEDTVEEEMKKAALISTGTAISDTDLKNIQELATQVLDLAAYRVQLFEYLQNRMHAVAPNLSIIVGETVGARLIAHAGSLMNLAKFPASTIQILGAEKALFRALKTRSNTPKYGIIFHSSFIGRAGAKNKGRISRYLANKCSIASRLDSFADEPTDLYGLKMKEQVEQRLNFYETGVPPQKNAEAMHEVAEELKAIVKEEKKEKK